MNKCPVCDSPARQIDVPKYNIYACDSCEEIIQARSDGSVVLLGRFFMRAALDDDRVRAAVSSTRVTSVKGFVDTFEDVSIRTNIELAMAAAELSSLLTRALNRIDYALGEFAALGLVSDNASSALDALREVRALVAGPRNEAAKDSHGSHRP